MYSKYSSPMDGMGLFLGWETIVDYVQLFC